MENGVLPFGPCGGGRVDEVVVAGGGNFQIMHVFALLLLLLGVIAAEGRGDNIVSGAVDGPLGSGMVDGKLHWVGVAVAVGNLAGRSAEERGHGIVAKVQFKRLPK